MQAADTLRDWAHNSPAVELREVEGDEILLLDETLPLTPKQLWKLLFDLTFIQHFYQKKGNREIGIGSWQKTGGLRSTVQKISPLNASQSLAETLFTLESVALCPGWN